MTLFRALVIWTVQALLFFDIHELIPSGLIFFAIAAALGWVGNRFWSEDWIYNPLL